MVPSCWQFAAILIFVLFASTSVVRTDTPACNSSDQNCLAIRRIHVLSQKKLDREIDSRETRQEHSDRLDHTKGSDSERTERDRLSDNHARKLLHSGKESRRLYDRIRDVKRSILDRQRNAESTTESRHLRASRRYADRYSDSRLTGTGSAERPETLRERLSHRLALTATDEGYETARAIRRFSRFRDDVAQSTKPMTRFERLRQYRLLHLNTDGTDGDSTRITSRFERVNNDKLARLEKDNINIGDGSESDHSLPQHFQNLEKMRDSLDRKESSFDRRNAYSTQTRNQVRISGDAVKGDRIESRFEIQRKQRQELEAKLREENLEGVRNEEQENFMENRRMRKEERRLIEERQLREEKQRLLEEERKIREEQRRNREREQKIREAERKVKEILRKIHENERLAREEKQRKLEEEKRIQKPTLEPDHAKTINQREQFENEQRIRDENDWLRRQYEYDYDEDEDSFGYDSEDEDDWDYSDYSNSASSESYEDGLGLRRRLREDIRHFPDIRRQIRENVQMYGREYLDARELFSDEVDDYESREKIRRKTARRSDRDENRFRHGKREREVNEKNSRRKRSIDKVSQPFRGTEHRRDEGDRQIAEKQSFRSQDERHFRKVNLRLMNENRQLDDEKTQNRAATTVDQRERQLTRRRTTNRLNRNVEALRNNNVVYPIDLRKSRDLQNQRTAGDEVSRRREINVFRNSHLQQFESRSQRKTMNERAEERRSSRFLNAFRQKERNYDRLDSRLNARDRRIEAESERNNKERDSERIQREIIQDRENMSNRQIEESRIERVEERRESDRIDNRRTEESFDRRVEAENEQRDSNRILRKVTRSRLNNIRTELTRNERNDKNRDSNRIQMDNRRIEESSNRRLEEIRNRNDERQDSDRTQEITRDRMDTRRTEESDRRIETENERSDERRNSDRIQETTRSRRLEVSYDRDSDKRIERNDEMRNSNRMQEIVRNRMDNRRTEKSFDRKTETENERNDERRESYRIRMINRRIEGSQKTRTEDEMRSIERRNSNRIRMNNRRIEESRIIATIPQSQKTDEIRNNQIEERTEQVVFSLKSEQEKKDSQKSEERNDKEKALELSFKEFLTASKQNRTIFPTLYSTGFLQAALIGIVVLKIFMQNGLTEKKLRSNYFFKNFESILNGIKTF